MSLAAFLKLWISPAINGTMPPNYVLAVVFAAIGALLALGPLQGVSDFILGLFKIDSYQLNPVLTLFLMFTILYTASSLIAFFAAGVRAKETFSKFPTSYTDPYPATKESFADPSTFTIGRDTSLDAPAPALGQGYAPPPEDDDFNALAPPDLDMLGREFLAGEDPARAGIQNEPKRLVSHDLRGEERVEYVALSPFNQPSVLPDQGLQRPLPGVGREPAR